jgi:uroporphyrinogen decarboxylase
VADAPGGALSARVQRERPRGDFLCCKTPALATEVTLQPPRFPPDAAILFSDILIVPDAMGLGLSFAEGEGPRFARPVRDERAIGRLAVPDPHGELRYVVDAVAEIRRALRGRVPLIGFAGSPFTLACYMIEGGSSDDFRTVKQMLYQRPELLHRLLDVNARAVAAYLNAQIEAGADAVMVFDTWGGSLAHAAYLEFSLAYTTRVVAALVRERDGERVPSIVFTKGGGPWLEAIAACGCDAVGVDWTVSLADARRRSGRGRDPVTSIRSCCSPIPTRSGARPSARSPISAARRDTSSTSATASCPRHPRTASRRWSKRSTGQVARTDLRVLQRAERLDLFTNPWPPIAHRPLAGVVLWIEASH